ncbi:MAG: type II toxin-antitoxin system HicB family antitoxin [Caldilineaceae bacterium]|nr:type II toxin-antitoxin system HicB family antitoxin [Caldilineaceae bacterium]
MIEPEDDWYVSYCEELGIASQGETANEAKKNLEEAVEMFTEDASLSEILSLLAALESESHFGIRDHIDIPTAKDQDEWGTLWELVFT